MIRDRNSADTSAWSSRRAGRIGSPTRMLIGTWRWVSRGGRALVHIRWVPHTAIGISGTPAAVADTLDEFVQAQASDGFILVPHITPGGLDEFADTVVPLLQERGVFRTEYEGSTLREHLGLGAARPDTVAGLSE